MKILEPLLLMMLLLLRVVMLRLLRMMMLRVHLLLMLRVMRAVLLHLAALRVRRVHETVALERGRMLGCDSSHGSGVLRGEHHAASIVVKRRGGA
jgi:hypothetical protein